MYKYIFKHLYNDDIRERECGYQRSALISVFGMCRLQESVSQNLVDYRPVVGNSLRCAYSIEMASGGGLTTTKAILHTCPIWFMHFHNYNFHSYMASTTCLKCMHFTKYTCKLIHKHRFIKCSYFVFKSMYLIYKNLRDKSKILGKEFRE